MAIPLERLEGKYEILERISEGGMGAVYLVRHRLLDEIRVVKTMRPQLAGDENLRARFLREARTAVKLRHPNIAQMYDFTMDEEGNAFIVMEYIEGIGLDELLRRTGPPSLPLAMSIARQSLAAIGYLHRKGLVHRDVSPDNLMLSRDDEDRPLIKMIDLGLAKALEESSHLTIAGTFLGKVRYASPEQFRVQEGIAVDHRSDLYSFGVVLYELLTGILPIKGTTLPTFISGHLFEPPVTFDASDSSGRIPEPLRTIVLRSLAKAPDDRPQYASEVLDVIDSLAGDFSLSRDELELALTLPDMPTTRIPVVRPGSTQARLDQQFGATSTPAPGLTSDGLASIAALPATDPPAPPPPPPDAPSAPPSPRAEPPPPPPPPATPPPEVSLPETVPSPAPRPPAKTPRAPEGEPPSPSLTPPPTRSSRDELPPRSQEERRAREMATVVASIQDMLARGDISAAGQALEVAERVFRTARPIQELRSRMNAVKHQQQAGRVSSLLTEVRRLADAGELPRAISELLGAIVESPGNQSLEAQLLDLRRREAATVVMEALAQGDMDAADRALRLAEKRFGSDDTLMDLRWRVDALRSDS